MEALIETLRSCVDGKTNDDVISLMAIGLGLNATAMLTKLKKPWGNSKFIILNMMLNKISSSQHSERWRHLEIDRVLIDYLPTCILPVIDNYESGFEIVLNFMINAFNLPEFNLRLLEHSQPTSFEAPMFKNRLELISEFNLIPWS